MVISQQTAANISELLTKTLHSKIAEAKEALAQYVYDEYIKQTPKEVQECFKKYPDWFHSKSSIVLQGYGFQWEEIRHNKKGVVTNSSNERAMLDLSVKGIAAEIKRLDKEVDKAKDLYEQTKKTIYNTLLALKTYKNITENFPEAAPLLPARANLPAIITNLEETRAVVRKLNPPINETKTKK